MFDTSSLLERSRPRGSTEVDRRELVRDFETGIVDRLERDHTSMLNVGIGIILTFGRDPRTQRPSTTVRPDFDSQVGFRFDPIGAQSIRVTLMDLNAEVGKQAFASRMLGVRAIHSLNRLIRYPWRDPITDATVVTALTDQERDLIAQRGITFQPPKE